MNEAAVIEICRQAILVMLKLLAPILIAALITGVIVSLVQAVTQIQEATLTFIPKMLVVFLMTLWLLPFMVTTLQAFTQTLSDQIADVPNDSALSRAEESRDQSAPA